MLPPPPRIDAETNALFLDFDGTLVPIAATPDGIDIPAAFAATIDAAQAFVSGALALVSGRNLASLDRHGALGVKFAAGPHGAELRGIPQPAARAEGSDHTANKLAQARRLIMQAALPIQIEDKGEAIALHYRQHPHLAETVRDLAQKITNESGDALALQPGHCVYEIRPAGISKADAVHHFLKHAPFAGRRPIFVGDDLTDEDGFRAASSTGGYGILVGDRNPSAARYRLADVAAVYGWLAMR